MEKWKGQVSSLADELALRYDRILIVAHSMGTLFALSEAISHQERVMGLFLLGAPLKIFMKPSAAVNSMKVIFDRVAEDDVVAVAARDSYSMIPSKNVLSYAGWLPRYLELFQEIKRVRGQLSLVKVPCYVFQSEKDELVSMGALRYLRSVEKAEISILRKSRHFYYDPEDYAYLLECFQAFLKMSQSLCGV